MKPKFRIKLIVVLVKDFNAHFGTNKTSKHTNKMFAVNTQVLTMS